jgi:hypothetical protein
MEDILLEDGDSVAPLKNLEEGMRRLGQLENEMPKSRRESRRLFQASSPGNILLIITANT